MQFTNHSTRRTLLGAALAIAALAGSTGAQAQGYPNRAITVIIPFAGGSASDVVTRIMLDKMSRSMGQPIIVENRPGAGGNTGTAQAAKAAPDGYTLLITVNNLVINPPLFGNVTYDPYKDFDPVAMAVGFSSAFSVHPSVPAKNVNELIAHIKANPGKLSFASPGLGTPSHLLGEQFKVTLGLDLVHVPYNGSGPAITATVAGHTPIGFASMSTAAPQAKEGKLRVLAVMSKNVSSSLPDVPTIAAAGYPGLDGDGWVGALVPAGTPKDIVTLLNREIARIIALPDVKERFATLGLDPIGGTPDDFGRDLRAEGEKWAKVIRAANIKVQ
jgi:tripartite-type tricarboxylate transporter receptor subunit TctC